MTHSHRHKHTDTHVYVPLAARVATTPCVAEKSWKSVWTAAGGTQCSTEESFTMDVAVARLWSFCLIASDVEPMFALAKRALR